VNLFSEKRISFSWKIECCDWGMENKKLMPEQSKNGLQLEQGIAIRAE